MPGDLAHGKPGGRRDGDAQGGQTVSVTINAAPGEPTFSCSIPGHRESGLVGSLIVE